MTIERSSVVDTKTIENSVLPTSGLLNAREEENDREGDVIGVEYFANTISIG